MSRNDLTRAPANCQIVCNPRIFGCRMSPCPSSNHDIAANHHSKIMPAMSNGLFAMTGVLSRRCFGACDNGLTNHSILLLVLEDTVTLMEFATAIYLQMVVLKIANWIYVHTAAFVQHTTTHIVS